jgi:L-aspartate oxidase
MLPGAVDVLVLGAGLAGLRAALSCLETSPDASVLVASLAAGPSGSSFANMNDALGIHVCLTDQDREDYVREVLALNESQRIPQLWLSPELLAIQAEEGETRLRDLVSLGLPFVRDDAGSLVAHSSCFSPHSRRAFVFTGLARAHDRFQERLVALGCRFAPGWEAAAVLSAATDTSGTPGRRPVAAGAILVPASGGEPVVVEAKAVVVALGGPGRLFAHSMAGPSVPGYGQGLLARAGAEMTNLGYLQYMWGTIPGKKFWQPAALGSGGYKLALPDAMSPDRENPGWAPSSNSSSTPSAPPVLLNEIVPELQALCARRAEHCPYGYGLDDSAMDLALADALDHAGTVTLLGKEGGALRVAPMAHASNGGAVIDGNAETSIPGLLACGECATGMHGANRLGGGMVLATQVFGHRAGVRAARIASSTDQAWAKPDSSDMIFERVNRAWTGRSGGLLTDVAERTSGLKWLAEGLSRYAVLGGRPGCREFAGKVRQRLMDARDWRLSISLKAGLGILEGLPFGSD